MNHKLIETIADLRREGFESPPQPTAPLEDGPDLDAAVEETILGLAKPGTSLYRELVSDAAGMQSANVGAEKIIKRLKQGGDPRDWEGF